DAAVTVAVRKDDVDRLGWDAPPAEDASTAAATGTAYGSSTETASTTGYGSTTETTDDTLTVPLREERIEAERRQRDAGEVTVGKHVTEQTQEMDVPVTRDEVEITRRRVDRPAGADEG